MASVFSVFLIFFNVSSMSFPEPLKLTTLPSGGNVVNLRKQKEIEISKHGNLDFFLSY